VHDDWPERRPQEVDGHTPVLEQVHQRPVQRVRQATEVAPQASAHLVGVEYTKAGQNGGGVLEDGRLPGAGDAAEDDERGWWGHGSRVRRGPGTGLRASCGFPEPR
jgi:hypothetical protein